jgi:hypothetical protein
MGGNPRMRGATINPCSLVHGEDFSPTQLKIDPTAETATNFYQ